MSAIKKILMLITVFVGLLIIGCSGGGGGGSYKSTPYCYYTWTTIVDYSGTLDDGNKIGWELEYGSKYRYTVQSDEEVKVYIIYDDKIQNTISVESGEYSGILDWEGFSYAKGKH